MHTIAAGARATQRGRAEWFTGTVLIDEIAICAPPSRLNILRVTFEPGARTAWHTHPLGQTLIVTDGRGRAQREGGPVVELHQGDVVWFAPGERHWHGAAPGQAMTHLAIHERLNGEAVHWLEHVTDAEYGAEQ